MGPRPALLRIGGNSVWGEWFAGLIDEVRVYNRALSAAEIQQDMQAPIGLPGTEREPRPKSRLGVLVPSSLDRYEEQFAIGMNVK